MQSPYNSKCPHPLILDIPNVIEHSTMGVFDIGEGGGSGVHIRS